MERRLGRDFSTVRVHDDRSAHAYARALGARAFTVGSDISFARGEFRPDSAPGRGVLAHELAHVAQQQEGVHALSQQSTQTSLGAAEREAESVRRAVERGEPAPPLRARSAPALQRLPGSPAGGCGVCYEGHLEAVGNVAHGLVETAMIAQWSFLTPRNYIPNVVPGLGQAGIPDFMEVTQQDAVAIGELKPNSPTGIKRGNDELAIYQRQLEALGMKVARLNLPPPYAPLKFPTAAIPTATCPATQDLYVDAPVNGLYTYWCIPDFRELRPRCKCRDKDDKEKVKDPIPFTVEQDVKVEKKTGEESGEKQEPKGEEEGPKEESRPEDVVIPIAAATALAAAYAARKQIAQGLAKKAAGRALVYVEAASVIGILLLYPERVRAGPSDELATEALLRALRQKGVNVPPELTKRVMADPELKALIEAGVKSGDLDKTRVEIQKKMLKLINDHPDQFSQEDLRILMTSAQASGRKGGASPTVAQLKAAIARARSGAKPAGAKPGAEAPAGSAPAKTGADAEGTAPAGTSGAAKKGAGGGATGLEPKPGDPAKAPSPRYPKLSAEVQKELDAAPAPVRYVLQQLLGKTGDGPRLDDVAVRRYLATVPPDLTSEEAGKLTSNLVSAKGKTIEDLLLGLAHAVQAVRAPAGKPAKPSSAKPAAAPAPAKAPQQPARSRSEQAPKPKTGKAQGGAGKKGQEQLGPAEAEKVRRTIVQYIRQWPGWDQITPKGNRYLPTGDGDFKAVGSELLVAYFEQATVGKQQRRAAAFFLAKVKSVSGRNVELRVTAGGPIIQDVGTPTGADVGAFAAGSTVSIELLEGGGSSSSTTK